MAARQAETTQKTTKAANKDFVFATGRRKEAVARVRLYEFIRDGLSWGQHEIKKGDILVNQKLVAEYFPGETNRFKYTEPLRVANAQNK